MLKKTNNFFAFIKIGSGRKLLLLDLFLWLIILYDLYIIKTLNLDIYHFISARNVWSVFSGYFTLTATLLIYVPPIISALVNFLFRDIRTFRETIPSRYRNAFFIFHFVTSIALAFFISISHELQILSGFKAASDGSGLISLSSYEYSPLYNKIFLVLTSVSVVTLVVKFLFSGLNRWAGVRTEFKLWFRLSDTSSEYFPKQKANLIFVNTASMAPSINWINTREARYRHTYQKMVPTSDLAKRYLMIAAEESRGLLRQYLFQDRTNQSSFSIEFLPGTSRALEVGLTQIENLGTIIVSPYEHPSQDHVVKWFAASDRSIKHQKLNMEYSMLNKAWNEQKPWLIQEIKSVIHANDNTRKIAILISEVHYLTGLFINVSEIIDELRPNYRTSNLVFIVDASQAVGNLLNPFHTLADRLHREDFYYFSAHKWLLSPNTCGVFVAEQNPSRYEIQPYDVFGADLPSATIDPGVIFGIQSSLEYLICNDMFHLRRFHDKSCFLKSYFMERIGEKFEVVKSASQEMNQSNFIALRPSRGYRWKDETVRQFWSELTKAGVDLTLDNLNGAEANTWWLRISFPYFLQLHLLKQLIKHLRARVTSIN